MAVGTQDRTREVRIYTGHARRMLDKVRAADAGDAGRKPHDLVWTRTQLELERLARWSVAGQLSPEQQREWEQLFAEIAEAMPAIRRLGLGEFAWPEGRPPLPEPGGYRPKGGRAGTVGKGSDARAEEREAARDLATEQRPIHPVKAERDRWRGMAPAERFRDAGYQRWAQSFRSRESLSAAGKAGYGATVSRYGKEFLHDRMADKRREQDPPRSFTERKLMSVIADLGEREDRSEYGGQNGTYVREHKIAPSRHADFAWPEKRKSIEAWGGVHTAKYFVEQDTVREANRRQIERARAVGWEVLTVTDEDLRPENRDATRARVRRFLA